MFLKQIITALLFILILPLRAEIVRESRSSNNVLVLLSYHMTHGSTARTVRAMLDRAREMPEQPEFSFVEFDALRTCAPEAWEQQLLTQVEKIRAGQYALVVAFDDMAIELLLAHHPQLPPEIPIVFSGYENCPPELKSTYPNVTGVTREYNFEANLQSALALYPQTRQVVILSDSAPPGQKLEQRLQARSAAFPALSFRYFNTGRENIQTIFRQLAALPEETLVFLPPWHNLADNDFQSLPAFGMDLAGFCRHPYWIGDDNLFGYGAIGGWVADSEDNGRQTAALIQEVLQKRSAAHLPIVSGRAVPAFDYELLQRHRLDISLLPPEAQLHNQPPGYWESHHREILAGGAIVGVLVCGCAGYIAAMRRSTRKTRGILETLPGRVGIINRTEKILYLHDSRIPDISDQAGKYLKNIPNIDYPKISAAAQEVFQSRRPLSLDYERNGSKRSMSLAPAPRQLFGQEALIWFSHDNDELQNVRKRAEENAEWLRLTLQSIGDGVLTTDRDGNIVLLNPVAERMLGCTREEAVGKPHEEYFHIVGALHDEPIPSPVRRALRTGMIVELANHTDLLAATGRRYHIADSAAPILGHDGEILGAILVFRDVTEQYESRDRLREALTTLEYASELARTAYVKMELATREVLSCSPTFTEYWPIRDGKAIPREECVHPDDLPGYLNAAEDILSGRSDIATWTYRSGISGSIRHYRMRASMEHKAPGKTYLIGVIQDITEITAHEQKLTETLELWNLVLDTIPVMIFAKDVGNDFRYTLTNHDFEEFVGRSKEEILHHTDYEAFGDPETAARFREWDERIMKRGTPESFLESPGGGDGRIRHLRTTKIPFSGTDGKPYLLGVTVDVTDQTLRTDKERILNYCLETLFKPGDLSKALPQVLRAIAEYMRASHCYILDFNMEQRHFDTLAEYAEDGFTPLVGGLNRMPFAETEPGIEMLQHQQEVRLDNLQDPAQQALVPSWRQTCIDRDIRGAYMVGIYLHDVFWGNLGIVYEKRPCGDFSEFNLGFLRSAAHIIELLLLREHSAQELKNALEQARAADRAKSFFLASMSHEIRTPLNAVIGFSELLTQGTLPETEQKDYLNSISSAGNALLALVNDVLDLSKLEAGQMSFSPVPTDFPGLVREVKDIFRQKCAERQLSFRCVLPKLPMIYLDKLRMRQILFNLVGNAVKFTPRGSIRIGARFEPDSATHGTLEFRVADTGIGISKEDQTVLFQPFVQSKVLRGTHTANNGTGLGLAIIQRMLEKMGGSIRLGSRPGKGSVFTVTLRHLEYQEAEASTVEPNAAAVAKVTLPAYSILLVDDIPMNLKVMSAVLNRLGATTVCATGAAEALERLAETTFDFLLTDLWMPDCNGEELARRVRSGDRCPKWGIIAVTADVESRESFDMSVFDAILTKPVTQDKVKRMFQAAQAIQSVR